MNDLELVREMRAEVPVPVDTWLADGRARLLAGMGREQRRHGILLPVTAAAAAAAIAAGAVGYGLSTGSGLTSRPAKTSQAPKAPTQAVEQAVLAARVLHEASAVVGRSPVTRAPGPGQWIYSKTIQYQYPGGTSSDEEWITFDGSQSGYYQNGQLIVHTSPSTPEAGGDPLAAFNADATPKTAYDALLALPEDPRALLTVIRKTATAFGAANLAAGTPVAGHMPKTQGQLEFDYLSLLLWNAARGVGGPPAAEAAVFRAIAAIHGVSVQQGITDAAGAPAIGVSADGYDQILLDPRSYQVIGLRQLSTGISPFAGAVPPAGAQLPKALRAKILEEQKRRADASWPHKGAVISSLAYARVSEVSGPGVR